MPNPVRGALIHVALNSHHQLRLSQTKQCVCSHIASEGQNQDLNLGPFDSTVATALLHYCFIVIMLLAVLIIGSLQGLGSVGASPRTQVQETQGKHEAVNKKESRIIKTFSEWSYWRKCHKRGVLKKGQVKEGRNGNDIGASFFYARIRSSCTLSS